MFKSVLVACILFGLALSANIDDFENNIIEYDVPNTPWKGYPYGEVRERRIPKTFLQAYNEPAPILYDQAVPAAYDPPVVVASNVAVNKMGIIATVASCAISAVKKIFKVIISHIPAIGLGSLIAIGICKFTPLCKIGGLESILKADAEVLAFASSENLATAANFVKQAVLKYQALQK